MFELNSLLVPVDFSAASRPAFERALELASGENPSVILLHVIDITVAEQMVHAELGAKEDIVASLRKRAERVAAYVKPVSASKSKHHLRRGAVFEIVRKAENFGRCQ